MDGFVKVSIAGVAFTFERDAYDAMNRYIKKLEAGYAQNPDGKEIIADIEARIAELILSEQENEHMVSRGLVDSIIDQLGFPDGIDADTAPKEEIPRRLYRNPDGAKIGGVCSGLGTFFRTDPVSIRIGIFVPLFLVILSAALDWDGVTGFFGSLFGVIVLLYFILWMAIPMAKTPRHKLEMRGEKITASSIKQGFEDDASAMSSSPEGRRSASVWGEIMYVIGRIILFMVKAVVFLVAFSFALGALAILTGIVTLIATGNIFMSEYMTNFYPVLEGISLSAYSVLVLFAILIPMAVIGYLLFKVVFSSKISKTFLMVTGIIWLVLMIYLTAITARNIDNIRDKAGVIMDESEYWEKYYKKYIDEDWGDDNVSVSIKKNGRNVVIRQIKVNPDDPSDTISSRVIHINDDTW